MDFIKVVVSVVLIAAWIVVAGETARVASQTPLFGNLPQQDAPAIPLAPKMSKLTPYPLRLELGVTEALWQERPLGYAELNDPAFIDEIAAEFCNRSSLLAQIHQTRRAAKMSLRDLFLADVTLARSHDQI